MDVFNVLLYFWLVSRCTLRVLIFSVSVAGAELQFAALSEMLWSSSCGPSSCCCICAVAPCEVIISSEISVEYRRGGVLGVGVAVVSLELAVVVVAVAVVCCCFLG